MKIKAKLVVMSHLSDIQDGVFQDSEINDRISFVKIIILHCNGDLNKEINPDEIWNDFFVKGKTFKNK